MNDPQHLGLGELGQRVQALSDPAPDRGLRPYQGTPVSAAIAANGRPVPADSVPAPSLSPYSRESELPPSAAILDADTRSRSGAYSQSPSWETVSSRLSPTAASAPPSTASASSQNSPSSGDPVALNAGNAPKSGLQRAFSALRSTLPLVQKILPLIDGNIATAVSALVAPQPHPPTPPPVHIDLEPVERGLAEIQNSHRELRGQVLEQVTNLKRVEDQLERVREATDRNTLEQQELVEDLRSASGRITLFAILGAVLLAVSLGLNIYLILQLQHILR